MGYTWVSMSTLRANTGITIAQYLNRERDSLEKHEYRDGEVLAMSGGSARHSLITANAIGELRDRLKGEPCRVYDSNLRVRIPKSVLYTYPDASVVCDPPQVDPDDPLKETVINPAVVVEMLSPSTEAYDRGEKFSRYCQLDSLKQYILVSQSMPRVELFLRHSDGAWLFTAFSGLDAVAQLPSLGITLALSEIYAGVDFSEVV
jgi:Uma2 family endonuclease